MQDNTRQASNRLSFLLPVTLYCFTPLNSGSSAACFSFSKTRFFCCRSCPAPRYSIVLQNADFLQSLAERSAIFPRFQKLSSAFLSFSKTRIFCRICRKYYSFPILHFFASPRSFCFPKSAFIAPVLPILIVFKYHSFLPVLLFSFWFLKSMFICRAP